MAALGDVLEALDGAVRAGVWPDEEVPLTGLFRRTAAKPCPAICSRPCPERRCMGGEFIQYALRMGAASVLTDAEGLIRAEADGVDIDIPIILHEDPRLALAHAARFWFKGTGPR